MKRLYFKINYWRGYCLGFLDGYLEGWWESRYPWEKDSEMKETLQLASWRYLLLVGIVAPDPLSESIATSDKTHFSHFIKPRLLNNGRLAGTYSANDALAFVHMATGYNLPICQRWMRQSRVYHAAKRLYQIKVTRQMRSAKWRSRKWVEEVLATGGTRSQSQ